jgi:hypothetical protein
MIFIQVFKKLEGLIIGLWLHCGLHVGSSAFHITLSQFLNVLLIILNMMLLFLLKKFKICQQHFLQ